MTSRTLLALVCALLLVFPLMAGCIGGEESETNRTGADSTNQSGSNGEDSGTGGSGGPGSSNQTGGDASAEEQDPAPSNSNEWTDSATVGIPYQFPIGPSAAEFTKMSIDNGANGTYVLAYSFNVPEGVGKLTVTANASQPSPTVPDYDLYVWNTTGGLKGASTNEGTAETVEVDQPTGGEFLIGLLYWAGADAEGNVAPVTINATAS